MTDDELRVILGYVYDSAYAMGLCEALRLPDVSPFSGRADLIEWAVSLRRPTEPAT